MREITFRGKRIDNGEWVEGAFVPENDVYPATIFYGPRCSIGEYVDPATVGQYTGLTDKNGKRIFEGDVVHILGDQTSENWKSVNYNALIVFLDGGFCAIEGTIEEHGFRRYALCRMDFSLEVIGNIHDNPELMKEEPK